MSTVALAALFANAASEQQLKDIANPIRLARLVMEKTHVSDTCARLRYLHVTPNKLQVM
jgi:hypothetical protein